MTKRAVHLASERERMSRCGWPFVDVEVDITRVTCKVCLRLFLAGAPLREVLSSTLAPSAGFPPRLTPQLWAASCRGGEHRHCGECVLCAWEHEANRWAGVEAWNRVVRPRRPDAAPRWASVAAALRELVEWERHGRVGPSAFGGILRRIASGEIGDGGRARPDDRLLGQAGELVAVRQALEAAYPRGAHRLGQAQRMGLLIVRTAGVVMPMPSYEELALLLGESEGELRALVRSGRQVVGSELLERGLVELPRRRRERPVVAPYRSEEAA